MFLLVHHYGIDIHDTKTIDLLIDEAQKAQIQNDYLLPLKKPLKTLAAILIPIFAYVAQKIGDNATQDEMITMSVQIITIVLMVFSLIFALNAIVRDIFFSDYKKYNELMYDLRQVKLFYANETSASPN